VKDSKRPVYSSDPKAPRMKKGDFSITVVTKDLWKQFKIEHPEYSKLTWDEFYQYWKDISYTIRKEVVENPLGVKLGSYTGEIKLQYLPHKFKAEDPRATQDLGERVNHLNITNRGKVAKIKWERRWAVRFNKMLQFFAFKATREIEDLANKYILDNPDKLRVARNTLGGYSIWRQLKNKK